ncbi:sulfatase-like hydrolase/transferase [bacterium]|nr:sulfatase-like hydrolase/transferase [bacterium]
MKSVTYVLVTQILVMLSGNVFAAMQPNILFVLTDDQGWWDVGMRGNQDIETPVMDRLAREGVDFTRFYAAPVCAPTRAGLMTGRYCFRTGLYNTRFGGDTLGINEMTIAQMLKRAGYRTGIFGKWHLGKYAPYQPQHRGFDEFLGHYHGHIDEYDYPDQLVHNGKPVEARKYVTDLFTDAAIEFIEHDSEQPWFCYLPLNAPHSPWVVGTSHDGQARGDALIEKYLKKGLVLREARIYSMIDIIDQNLGRLLTRLNELGETENTVVLFMTDNGGVSRHFKAGLNGNKASVYEGGVRVPLFVRWPGRFPAGAKIDAQCSHVDLFPTFCELAGVDVPNDREIDGRSLLPLLKTGQGEQHHEYVYHAWDRYFPNPDNRWSISDQRWKLLCQVGAGQQGSRKNWRLFDLANDPGETHNVFAQQPETAERLRNEFVRWFEDVTDGVAYEPVPIPVGHPAEPLVEIQPSWATWHGENIEYVFRGYDWDTIEGWKTPGEHADWKLDVLHGGRYAVEISYARLSRDRGTLRLSVGEASLECSPPPTPTADVFERVSVGTLDIQPGSAELKAEVVDAQGDELLRLNRIFLRRLADASTGKAGSNE